MPFYSILEFDDFPDSFYANGTEVLEFYDMVDNLDYVRAFGVLGLHVVGWQVFVVCGIDSVV